MGNNNDIVFFSSFEDIESSSNFLEFKTDTYTFIEIKEHRKQKTNFIKFLENEFLSISFLSRFFKIFKFVLKALNLYSQGYKQGQKQSLINLNNLKCKLIFDYYTPALVEKCDELSREIFNRLKTISFFREDFKLVDISLFEANRFEFVHKLYYLLLNLFAIKHVFIENHPQKVYIAPAVNFLNKSIIKELAQQFNIPIIQILNQKSRIRNIIKRNSGFITNLAERIWFWHIWKILRSKRSKIEETAKNKAKILTLLHYKNFYPSMNQVLTKIDKSNKYSVCLFAPHKLLKYLEAQIRINELNNVKIVPIMDYDYSFYRANYKSLNKDLNQILRLKELEAIKYDSIDLSKFLKIIFYNIFEKYTLLIRYFVSLKAIIRKINPQLIIVLSGNDPFDVLATHLAKSYNIPTLFIPHALISKRRDFTALKQDYVVCAGKRDSDYYVSLGTLQDKIRILGIPLYDKTYEEITKIKSKENVKEFITAKFNLRPENKIILLVTSFHEDHIRAKIFKSVVNAVQDLKDCQLVVKLHPIETDEFYRRIITQEGFNYIPLIQEKILHKLIIASDLVIGSISGAQIEALLLGKNVINLVYERLSDPLLMDKYNAALTVFNPDQLKSVITKSLYDQETQKILQDGRKQYLEYCLYKFDGNSSLRVYDLINEILG
jgi:hypothetical protein